MEPDKITSGEIKERILEEEMQQSYLDYAMSVIVARALPDVRDGLKPVQRRILYSMHELGLKSNAKHVKSARVVGDTHGKYHPHGDVAIYDALARLAQDFSMRYPLIDGQGNFGSMDGDAPAAQRYTEVKMAKIAEEMLSDLEKETVDFVPNYDATYQEPKVLPTRVPQLLMNGTVGIAVGMATNIPPHNLSELMNGLILLIDKPESSVEDLLGEIKGPDFPTGGIIFNPQEIKTAYSTGRGRIVMRAVAEIEERGKETHQIVVSQLPFQTNKATLLEKIAELVRDKKIVGISDIRDESDREGVRIVIELKKEAYPKKVLNQLFKMTALQSVFHVNLLALVDGLQPQVLDLKQMLSLFIDFRREVVRRRTVFDLKKAEERAHILEGLITALSHLDAVISTIKKSADKEEAKSNLMKKFKLTETQANAILEMRLSALAALERQKTEDELKEKKKLITEFRATLKEPQRILSVVKNEFKEIQEKYKSERRTQISSKTVGEFTEKDLIPNEEVVITITQGGYVKRQPLLAFRTQQRGGRGVLGMQTKEEDVVDKIQAAFNHDDILFFTNRGRLFRQKVYEIPLSSRIAKGTPVVNLIQLAPDEKVTSWLTIPGYKPEDSLVMVTAKGFVKKTQVKAYENVRASGLIAIKLDGGDDLRWVRYAKPKDEVIITTREGQAIRFDERDVRPMGRAARGVRGIKLRPGDEVVGVDVTEKESRADVLVISDKGLGKRTTLADYSLQHRGGVGVKTIKLTDKTGKLKGARLVADPGADLIVTSTKGQVIRVPLKSVPILSRATQGVRIIRLSEGDKVASFTIISPQEEEGKIQAAKSGEQKVESQTQEAKGREPMVPPRSGPLVGSQKGSKAGGGTRVASDQKIKERLKPQAAAPKRPIAPRLKPKASVQKFKKIKINLYQKKAAKRKFTGGFKVRTLSARQRRVLRKSAKKSARPVFKVRRLGEAKHKRRKR